MNISKIQLAIFSMKMDTKIIYVLVYYLRMSEFLSPVVRILLPSTFDLDTLITSQLYFREYYQL